MLYQRNSRLSRSVQFANGSKNVLSLNGREPGCRSGESDRHSPVLQVAATCCTKVELGSTSCEKLQGSVARITWPLSKCNV